jgi:hypothetical protein
VVAIASSSSECRLAGPERLLARKPPAGGDQDDADPPPQGTPAPRDTLGVGGEPGDVLGGE